MSDQHLSAESLKIVCESIREINGQLQRIKKTIYVEAGIECCSDAEIEAEYHKGDFDIDTHLTPEDRDEHTEHALKVLGDDNA